MEETGQLMARTRDEQGQRILEAASELLSTEGASALSVRRIAAAAATWHAYDAAFPVMFGGAVPGFVPSDSSHELAHGAFDGFVAKVARCTDAGLLAGSADQIAELLWSSIHGLVMLEIVGINPLMSDPVPRFERALDVLFEGLTRGGRTGG